MRLQKCTWCGVTERKARFSSLACPHVWERPCTYEHQREIDDDEEEVSDNDGGDPPNFDKLTELMQRLVDNGQWYPREECEGNRGAAQG